jgi:Na+/H+ antiporter NhaD/arsenite permease-like protein
VVALLLLRWLFRADLRKQPSNVEALQSLNARAALRDPVNLRRVLIVLAVTLVLFSLQGILGVSPAFIAMSGAAVAMLWIRPDVDALLKSIEWSVLLFFAALFVVVGGLSASGALHGIAMLLKTAGSGSTVFLGLATIWGVALLSAVVDNIPITIALIPVILEVGTLGINIAPLWWALALGAGLGGNGTVMGATANVIVVSISERTHYPITARLWMRRGLPVMMGTLVVASILYVIAFGWLSTP